MAVVSMSYLLEAGVHFGHQTKRWNPKMKEFIFTARDDIYIIDLQKTLACIEESYQEIRNIATNNGTVLFVGTKKQASEATKEEALRSGSYYVTERWLGGTLTNFRTIRKRIKRLEEIENMEKEGVFLLLPKKEVIGLKKEYEKLNRVLAGIREMVKLPQALVVVDPKKEINAIKEARILNIPVFGIVDTNGDPDDVDYIIPGNDDAVRSIKLLLGVLNNAVCEAKGLELIDFVSEEDIKDKKQAKEVSMAEVLTNEKVIDKDEEAYRESRKENTYKPKKEFKKYEKKEISEKTSVIEPKAKIEEVKEEIDFDSKTLVELKSIAKEKGIKGISTMKKADLIAAIKE